MTTSQDRPSEFGQRLRLLRRDAGLTQAQLAGDELTPGYISLLEAGKRTPSSEVLNLLATRLGCSTTHLDEGRRSEREERVDIAISYARFALAHQEPAEARRQLEPLAEQGDVPLRVEDEILDLLGQACDRMGALEDAARVLGPLLDRACQGQTHLLVTELGTTLCGIYIDSGDYVAAVRIGEKALAAAREQHLTGTSAYFRLAATYMSGLVEQGNWLQATLFVEDALALLSRVASPQGSLAAGEAALYWNAGELLKHGGDLPRARARYEKALAVMGEMGTTRDLARLQMEVADLLLTGDEPDLARAGWLLDGCIDTLEDLGSRVDLARFHVTRSRLCLFRGDPEAAEAAGLKALDMASAAAGSDRAAARMALGDTLRAQGRDYEAAEAYGEAAIDLGAMPPNRRAAVMWRELADRLADARDIEGAANAYARALDGCSVRDRRLALARQIAALRDRPKVPVGASPGPAG